MICGLEMVWWVVCLYVFNSCKNMRPWLPLRHSKNLSKITIRNFLCWPWKSLWEHWDTNWRRVWRERALLYLTFWGCQLEIFNYASMSDSKTRTNSGLGVGPKLPTPILHDSSLPSSTTHNSGWLRERENVVTRIVYFLFWNVRAFQLRREEML